MIRWRLASSAGRATPVALFELSADAGGELDSALADIAAHLAPGTHRVATIAGTDRGLIARPAANRAMLMPHGGPVIIRSVMQTLHDRFGPPSQPEPVDIHDRIARALATARSPLAIDLLLAQAQRWGGEPGKPARSDPARDRRLWSLLSPPTVALWGPPNVGKSTLLNTLAGRSAAMVADAPGTTRDHIGVEVDFAGLVCRVLDLPGIRPTDDLIEARAIEIATRAVAAADLILLVGDASHAPVELPGDIAPARPPIRVGLRSDLAAPGSLFDVSISAHTGDRVATLVSVVRDAFVPPEDLTSDLPWRFWQDAPSTPE